MTRWRSLEKFRNRFARRFLGNKRKTTVRSCSLNLAKGADFRSLLRDRRRHGRRRVFILQIIGPRSQVDSVRPQVLLDMSDTDNTPPQVALGNCEENADKLRTLDLGIRNCWGNARRAGPIGPISRRTAAVSLWTAWNSTSTLLQSSVVCRRQFACLTKAFHGRATALDVETWATNGSNRVKWLPQVHDLSSPNGWTSWDADFHLKGVYKDPGSIFKMWSSSCSETHGLAASKSLSTFLPLAPALTLPSR